MSIWEVDPGCSVKGILQTIVGEKRNSYTTPLQPEPLSKLTSFSIVLHISFHQAYAYKLINLFKFNLHILLKMCGESVPVPSKVTTMKDIAATHLQNGTGEIHRTQHDAPVWPAAAYIFHFPRKTCRW